MKLSQIKPNPNNPRLIKDDKFEKLCNSIKEFPKMMELRPIVIDENLMILGGNMRFKALKELGYKEVPNEWIKKASELTEEEKKRFIISDNSNFGDWDTDLLLQDWDAEKLADWGCQTYWQGVEANNLNEQSLDITENFDPYGNASEVQRVVFIFLNKEDAETYLSKNKIQFTKQNMAWQVNMSTQSI